MTTKIIVETDKWPVKVITRERLGQNFHPTGDKTVQPNSSETFHISSSTALAFEEQPEPSLNKDTRVEPPAPVHETAGRRVMRTEERVKAEKAEEETAARR